MSDDLQLIGRSERTQQAYLRAVRKLAEFYRTSPDKLSEQRVRNYFLTIKNEHHYAPGSLRVASNGIRFFYTHTRAGATGRPYGRSRFPIPKRFPKSSRLSKSVERPPIRCVECGGPMRIVAVLNENCRALIEHSLLSFGSQAREVKALFVR